MNVSDCGGIGTLFPDETGNAPRAMTSASAIGFQALPTASVALAWLLMEARRARAPPRALLNAFLVLGLAATGALGVVLWRTFELLDCDPDTHVTGWGVFAVVVGVGLALLLLYVVAPYRPRLAVAGLLACAGGTVAVDWSLRGGVVSSPAAQHLVATQQLVAFLAVCALQLRRGNRVRRTAPPRRRGAPRCDANVLAPVDALAKRRDEPAPAAGSWSWFAV